MLSRGYFIGEIVDDLATLGGQVKMRNAIHMFDLTVATENFFRDVLNILLDASFKNLNANRSNEPGLDLGDENKKIGVQVTSSATTDKVNHTLGKITTDQASKYAKIVVLGMNRRQRAYSIDVALAKKYDFTTDDIWDLDTLARKAFDLQIDKLQDLYNLVRSSSARLKIELEVPDENGKFPTSGYDMWEQRAKPKVGDGRAFCSFVEEHGGDAPDIEKVQKALKKLGADLSRLPRLTREFLAMLYERRERGKSRRFGDGWSHLLLSKVQREYRGDDLDGELDILRHADFLDVNGEDAYELGATEIGLTIPTELDELQLEFVSFVVEKKIGFRNVIGSIDLSAF
ncbi:Uncharacterised protein [Burkholderia pseudomallei]|nr:Uncharacterised protein [Burkholderia pseudomallei]